MLTNYFFDGGVSKKSLDFIFYRQRFNFYLDDILERKSKIKGREKNQTNKNVVKYDPLKRIFLGKFSYVRTEIYANLRSYSASIILTYIHVKFKLV